jgi:hypothetical protein
VRDGDTRQSRVNKNNVANELCQHILEKVLEKQSSRVKKEEKKYIIEIHFFILFFSVI